MKGNKYLNTVKQTAIYSLGTLSTKVIGFLLLPVYTNPKYLSVSDYGIWATLDVTSQILIGVLALNLPIAMLRWASPEKDERRTKKIIFTTLVAILLIIAISLIFLLPGAGFFSALIFGTKNYSSYFVLLFISAAFGIYNGIPLNILRLQERPAFYALATSLKFTAVLLMNIYFVVFCKEGVIGIIKGQLIGEIFLSVITSKTVATAITFKFDSEVLRGMLKYGTPLVFSTVSAFILSFGDRYILLHFLDEAKVGIYSLGYKIASVINMLLLQSFQLGFLPIAYKKLGEADEKHFLSKILTLYAIVLSFSALGLSLFGKEIIELFAKSDKFLAAATVIPIIAFAFVIKGIQYNFALSFHYSKRTVYNAAIVIITAVTSLTLNFILIPRLGFIGAAYSMLLAILLMTVLSYYYGQKVYHIPFERGKLIKIIALALSVFAISLLVAHWEIWQRAIAKGILLISFLVLIFHSGILEKTEKEEIKRLFLKLRKN
jgi:O-antigen/teichoic acid export membrane protein